MGTPRGQLLCLQPSVGVGTFTEFEDQTRLHRAVRRANRVGYHLFDTASMCDTEEVVGSAIRDAMNAGEVRKQTSFFMSKLWNNDHHDVRAACRLSLHL